MTTSGARRAADASTSRTCSSTSSASTSPRRPRSSGFRRACSAITVDEYQDVNLLQQTLLDLWLGERDDLCVVGDDYQAIYSFTGATPRYLLSMPTRFPTAAVVRLEDNYRSTPQVLELANRLVPRLGGAEKTLRAVLEPGPEPAFAPFASTDEEVAEVVGQIRRLRDDGVADDEIAVLYRVNARSDDLEDRWLRPGFRTRFAAARSSSARRPGPCSGCCDVPAPSRQPARSRRLRRRPGSSIRSPRVSATTASRSRRISAASSISRRHSRRDASVSDFVADLEARFGAEGEGRGVQLLTYHRAKGLEFEVVFLPFLVEGELPFKQARTDEALAEERRLLYVGLTRAKRLLALSWSGKKPSPLSRRARPASRAGRPIRRDVERAVALPTGEDGPVFTALRAWRLERARADGVPAYVVFDNKTLAAIAVARPATRGELAAVHGVGPTKLDRYGDEVLALIPAR